MILFKEYFGPFLDHKDATEEVKENAEVLLERVNNLLDYAFQFDIDLLDNPTTKSLVSGTKYGGFRPQDCKMGAPSSAHKVGMAVDIYDPKNSLDNWLTDTILSKFALYRESPLHTPKWCHLTTRPPKSNKRTFSP